MVIRCHNCGVRVKFARECFYCGISQVERLHGVLVRLAYGFGIVAVLTTGAAFLGKSTGEFRPHVEDSGLPSQEEIDDDRQEVPWLFAKEMSDAVGRDVSFGREKQPIAEEN